MDAEQILLALVGAGASFMTFCLMRFPQIRRQRFRPYGPFSFTASVSGALAIFVVSTLIVCTQSLLG